MSKFGKKDIVVDCVEGTFHIQSYISGVSSLLTQVVLKLIQLSKTKIIDKTDHCETQWRSIKTEQKRESESNF